MQSVRVPRGGRLPTQLAGRRSPAIREKRGQPVAGVSSTPKHNIWTFFSGAMTSSRRSAGCWEKLKKRY